MPMAWRFRSEFQARLGLVFDHLSTIYHSFPGRITAETFKKQISAVVDIWEDWIVFPPEFTTELRARLEGAAAGPVEDDISAEVHGNDDEDNGAAPVVASRFKTSAFKPAEMATADAEAAADDADGEPMDEDSDVDGKPVDDVDGDPLDADVDGEPVENVDGEPLENVDGEPLENVDGESMENVDGEPMEDVEGDPMDDVDGDPIGDIDGASIGSADVDGEPMDDIDGSPVPV